MSLPQGGLAGHIGGGNHQVLQCVHVGVDHIAVRNEKHVGQHPALLAHHAPLGQNDPPLVIGAHAADDLKQQLDLKGLAADQAPALPPPDIKADPAEHLFLGTAGILVNLRRIHIGDLRDIFDRVGRVLVTGALLIRKIFFHSAYLPAQGSVTCQMTMPRISLRDTSQGSAELSGLSPCV